MALHQLSVLSCLYSRLVLGSPLTVSWRPTPKPTNCSLSELCWTSWPSIPDSPELTTSGFQFQKLHCSAYAIILFWISVFDPTSLLVVFISPLGFAPCLAGIQVWVLLCFTLCLSKAWEDLRFFYVTMYWFCLQRPLLSTPLVKRVVLPFGWE